jgi:glutamate-1-semialdehyde aminotransferase
MVDCRASFSRELIMNKIIVVGLAILAVSTSAALAKAKKPKEAAATASTASTNPLLAGVSAADRELYKKNKAASGMK